MKLSTARYAVVLATAIVFTSACGSDTSTDQAAEPDSQGQAESAGDGGEQASSGGQGVVKVADVTVTFTPGVCLTGDQMMFNGPGTTDSGDLAFVDSGDNNQLNVYIGTDDPFGDAEFTYEHTDVMNDLNGLQINGATITATPEMSRTDDNSYASVGAAELEVTCN